MQQAVHANSLVHRPLVGRPEIAAFAAPVLEFERDLRACKAWEIGVRALRRCACSRFGQSPGTHVVCVRPVLLFAGNHPTPDVDLSKASLAKLSLHVVLRHSPNLNLQGRMRRTASACTLAGLQQEIIILSAPCVPACAAGLEARPCLGVVLCWLPPPWPAWPPSAACPCPSGLPPCPS